MSWFCSRRSWILAVLPAFVPSFGSHCLQQMPPLPPKQKRKMKRSPTGWLSNTPVPEICAVELISKQPGTPFMLTSAAVPEQSLLLQLRCLHSLLCRHHTWNITCSWTTLLLETTLLPGTLGMTLLGCSVPLLTCVCTASRCLQLLRSTRQRNRAHTSAPPHPCLATSIRKLFSFWTPHIAVKIKK